ncbi:uncharacterized protein LODBEIA_P24170 [Lodderomyces beijingensis]|uniref:UDP-glucose:glycoprotein glucosyltransferase n=1 Tax=Lodderomyces beijingensis TaxID=1775926 RepID=A0ABP0ZKL9_9ASCO
MLLLRTLYPYSVSLSVSLFHVAVAVVAAAASAGELDVAVEAPWAKTDFIPNFIESVAGFDENLYIPTIEAIFGGSGDEDDDNELETFTDQEIYRHAIDRLQLNKSSVDFINFNLATKKFVPRAIAHYNHYDKLLAEQGDKLKLKCSHDSFGNLVETKNGAIASWASCNNKIYCSANDLFAIQTDKCDTDVLLFDRIVGNNTASSLLTFYGDPATESARNFLKILNHEARAGKLRFIWRYIPSTSGTRKKDTLSGYSAELTLLEADAIESFQTANSDWHLPQDFVEISHSNQIIRANRDSSINDVGAKIVSFVLSNTKLAKFPKFNVLKTILNDLPKFLHYLQLLPNDYAFQKVKSRARDNEKAGLSSDSLGIYINGSPIHQLELDIFKLGDKIQEELKFVDEITRLGFTTAQAKLLISKFALLSAVKQAQFESGNTLMGNNENRFKVYEFNSNSNSNFQSNSVKSGGVVFFNDVEKDRNYDMFSSNRHEVYLGPESAKLKPNQLPPLKENIHDLIFAINLGSKEQLKVFFAFSKLILDTGIPQQIGLLPLVGDDPLDIELARAFYHILKNSNPIEAMALLYKYLETKDEKEVVALIAKAEVADSFQIDLETVPNQFSISVPSIIVNGVIHDLASSNWQISMSKQIAQDVNLVKSFLKQGPVEAKLKDLIYQNAKKKRNLQVHPLNPRDNLYKRVDEDLYKVSIAFKKIDEPERVSSGTFWLVSDFKKEVHLTQLATLLRMMRKEPVQVRVINLGDPTRFDEIVQSFKINSLTNSEIEKIIAKLGIPTTSSYGRNEETAKLLESKMLPSRHSYLLLNSRYIRLDDNMINSNDLKDLLDLETSQRLRLIEDILVSYPDKFLNKIGDFKNKVPWLNSMDWFDLLSSVVTKSFQTDDKSFVVDVNRFDFDSLDLSNSVEVTRHDDSKPVDLLLLIDPLKEYSQKLVNMLDSVKDFSFLNIRILMQPKLNNNNNKEEVPVRFYRGVYPRSVPEFDAKGRWAQQHNAAFESLAPEEYKLEVDVPRRWNIVSKSCSPTVDLGHFKANADKNISVKYLLSNLIIEGDARLVSAAGRKPDRIVLAISSDWHSKDTSVMSAMRYFQLPAVAGVNTLKADSKHGLLSVSHKFESNLAAKDKMDVPIFSLDGAKLLTRLACQEQEKEITEVKAPGADINIFTILTLQDHSSAKLAAGMIASVRKHNSQKSIKFWILATFVSPEFKSLIPLLEEKYTVEIELISYKWPNFLRSQRDTARVCSGYKILFLDVLLPQTLDRVIFMDAGSICRSDLTDLVNYDLKGAPYAFASMCETKHDSEKFWKQGFWLEALKGDLKYHHSGMFVVDLQKFRDQRVGDALRYHYQKLSSDPQSLVILDQDLVNTMQRQVAIETLPQTWLWDRNWCSDKNLEEARIVMLNDGVDNKVVEARKVLPEWPDYEEQIDSLLSRAKTQEKPEQEQEKDDDYDDDEGLEELENQADFNSDDDNDKDYHDEL